MGIKSELKKEFEEVACEYVPIEGVAVEGVARVG